MDYVYLDFITFKGYQESQNGQVTRYLDEDGNFLFDMPPIGNGGILLDGDPPRLDWML
jgi:hypothetical protein